MFLIEDDSKYVKHFVICSSIFHQPKVYEAIQVVKGVFPCTQCTLKITLCYSHKPWKIELPNCDSALGDEKVTLNHLDRTKFRKRSFAREHHITLFTNHNWGMFRDVHSLIT